MTFAKLRAELIRDEGRRLDAYKDSLGYWTIGIGHYLGLSRRMVSINHDECEALFRWDVGVAEGLACRTFSNFGTLEDVRQRALVNMCFNLGGRIAQFKRFIPAVVEQRWEDAGASMLNSLWARQVGKRAERLRIMVVHAEEPVT